MQEFSIKSIIAKTHDQSFGGQKWRVEIEISIDAKLWRKYKDRKNLGMLYGVDISNAVYRINHNIPASCPTVDDRRRAANGVKTIKLTYFLNDAAMAENLGLKTRITKTSFEPVYGDFVDVLAKKDRSKPQLRLVAG